MKRCTGHCCQCFSLPYDPDQLRAIYDRWLMVRAYHWDGGFLTKNDEPARFPMAYEIHLIYPMVEYVGSYTQPPFKAINPYPKKLQHYYRCKHFDAKKKICTIYDIRPQMCRDYPYPPHKCNYAACTWSGHKQRKGEKLDKELELKKATSKPAVK